MTFAPSETVAVGAEQLWRAEGNRCIDYVVGARREHDRLIVEQRADHVGGACSAVISARLYDGVADGGPVLVGIDVVVAQGIYISEGVLDSAADGTGRKGQMPRGDADGDRSRPPGGGVQHRLAAAPIAALCQSVDLSGRQRAHRDALELPGDVGNSAVLHEHEYDGLGALAFPDGGAYHTHLGHQSVSVPLLDLPDPFEGGFALALPERPAGKGQHKEGDNRCRKQPE
jgi:hypothetical protein